MNSTIMYIVTVAWRAVKTTPFIPVNIRRLIIVLYNMCEVKK